jgi:hypothetical protein
MGGTRRNLAKFYCVTYPFFNSEPRHVNTYDGAEV